MELIEQSNDNWQLAGMFKSILQYPNERVYTEGLTEWLSLLGEQKGLKQFDIFKQLSKNHIEVIEDEAEKKWAEAIIYITLAIKWKGSDASNVWTFELAEGANDLNLLVLGKINDLYVLWKEEDGLSARPLAFYLLIQGIVQNPNAEVQRNYLLRADTYPYLTDYIGKKDGGGNCLTNFAIKYSANIAKTNVSYNQPAFIEHFKTKRMCNINMADLDGELKTLVVGITRSGKSALITETYLAVNTDWNYPVTSLHLYTLPGGAKGELENYLTRKDLKPTVGDKWELKGTVRVNATDQPLIITDTRGGLITEYLEAPDDNIAEKYTNLPTLAQELLKTDQLIVMIDPTTLLNQSTLSIQDFLKKINAILPYVTKQGRKYTMIALVFSKFDEYGALLPPGMPANLIHSSVHKEYLEKYFSIRNAKKNDRELDGEWNDLVNCIAGSYDLLDTRVYRIIEKLLTAIRPLFAYLRQKQHAAFNLYLESALSSVTGGNFRRSGIPEIFNDFASYIEYLKGLKITVSSAEAILLDDGALEGIPLATTEKADKKGVKLRWRYTGDVSGVSISVSRSNKSFTEQMSPVSLVLNSLGGGVFESIDLSIGYGNTYYYSFFLFNKDCPDLKSEEVKLFIQVPPHRKPSPPLLESAVFKPNKSIEIRGKDVNRFGTTWNLFKLNDQTAAIKYNKEKIVPAKGTITIIGIDNIEYGKSYQFVAKSYLDVDDTVTSEYSNPVTIQTPPRKIPYLNATSVYENKKFRIKLNWDGNGNEYKVGFKLQRMVSMQNHMAGWKDIVLPVNGDGAEDKDVNRKYTYSYRIQALNAGDARLESEFTDSNKVIIPGYPIPWTAILIGGIAVAVIAVLIVILIINNQSL